MIFDRLNHVKQPPSVIVIPYSVQQAFLGSYFFGQTELLTFGSQTHAWGALVNPVYSGVNLFWNVYTISNFTDKPLTTEFWLNSSPIGKIKTSTLVASSNQAIVPCPSPKVVIQYAEEVPTTPRDGIYSFTRRVEPHTTLTRHDFQGLIILPPGGNAIGFIKSPGQGIFRARIAYGWWEEKVNVTQHPGNSLKQPIANTRFSHNMPGM